MEHSHVAEYIQAASWILEDVPAKFLKTDTTGHTKIW